MPLWYVVHLATYLDIVSIFKIQRSSTTEHTAYISNKLFSELRHLASYVSRDFAMAYDRGVLRGMPHMDVESIQKYLAPSQVMAKGHMQQPCQGLHSTQRNQTGP
jgi:hypothetical protein